MRREDVERKKLDLKIIPMDLDILIARLDIWDFQVKFSSRTTPRKTVSLNCAIVLSFITTLKLEECFFCRRLNSIKFVLLKFRHSLFALNQFDSLSSSQFKVLIRKSGSVCEINKFVSSANKIESSFEALFKSFMYRIKNSGPGIDPCGTPQ